VQKLHQIATHCTALQLAPLSLPATNTTKSAQVAATGSELQTTLGDVVKGG